MSTIRSLLHKKMKQSLDPVISAAVCSSLKLQQDPGSSDFVYLLPLKVNSQLVKYDIDKEAENLVKSTSDNLLKEVFFNETNSKRYLLFKVDKNAFIKDTLENNSNLIKPSIQSKRSKVVIDFSSPNVAKPFHVGHLRSTIMGNYIANMNKHFDNRVTKINYLGDWGTQFGYLSLGMELAQLNDDELREDPLRALYKAYVDVNKLAEGDPTIHEKAREIFNNMESGDSSENEKWKMIRELTTNELAKTYKRLNIQFDEYHWESTYRKKNIEDVISSMNNILATDEENKQIVPLNSKFNIPIIKSDGTTLYLTRDIAAAIDRYNKFQFDSMVYVVEAAQRQHFLNLNYVLSQMGMDWADRIQHVAFGKIRGMSTRKGTVVFLQDFLDEARAIMRLKQEKSHTTKVSLDSDDKTSEILAISAVIINDFKIKRQKDYDFKWNSALEFKGETGVSMQYTHCRLSSIEEVFGDKLTTECDPTLLQEPVVLPLVLMLNKFDEAVYRAYNRLEPCYLVSYVFDLMTKINGALNKLPVKGQPNDIASQRLLLFHTSKMVLAQAMKLLCLNPLTKM